MQCRNVDPQRMRLHLNRHLNLQLLSNMSDTIINLKSLVPIQLFHFLYEEVIFLFNKRKVTVATVWQGL